MSSNNICLCIIFNPFVHNSLWTSACKYTSYLSHFGSFCVDFYVSSVYLTSSVPRWRTKNLTWPVCCISYFLTLSLSLILGCLFTIFNVIIDHMYKGSFVISVCIGKRKILLLKAYPVKLFICFSMTPYCTIALFLVCLPLLGLVW